MIYVHIPFCKSRCLYCDFFSTTSLDLRGGFLRSLLNEIKERTEEIRLARAVARDHSTIEKVRARMRAQQADQDLQRADLVINNDGKTSILTLCEEIIRYLNR